MDTDEERKWTRISRIFTNAMCREVRIRKNSCQFASRPSVTICVSRCSRFQHTLQPVKKRMLRFLQLFARFRHREEPDTINLREALNASRSWRPFEFEGVALQRLRPVPITRERPGVDDLSALLFDGAEFDELAARRDPGFLFELANRGRERVFAGFNLPFRNAPIAVVLAREKRPTRMREENFHLTVAHAVHQQARAGF